MSSKKVYAAGAAVILGSWVILRVLKKSRLFTSAQCAENDISVSSCVVFCCHVEKMVVLNSIFMDLFSILE